jgi:hypothetical protein
VNDRDDLFNRLTQKYLGEHPDLSETSPEVIAFQQRATKLCGSMRELDELRLRIWKGERRVAELELVKAGMKLVAMTPLLPAMPVPAFVNLAKNMRELFELLASHRSSDLLAAADAAPVGSPARGYAYKVEECLGLLKGYQALIRKLNPSTQRLRDLHRDACVRRQCRNELTQPQVEWYLETIDELRDVVEEEAMHADLYVKFANALQMQLRHASRRVAVA